MSDKSVQALASTPVISSSIESQSKVYLALFSVQIFFGIHYFAAKEVLKEIPAPVWASLRVSAAAFLMLLICLPQAKNRLPKNRGDLLRLFVYAIFGVIINQICFTEGLARTAPTHSAIINTSIPIATLVFAILLGKEYFSLNKLACIIVSLSGVLYLLKIDQFQLDNKYLIGDLLTLTNACSFSFFLVISKQLVSKYDAFVTTAILLAFGAVGITLYGLKALLVFQPSTVSASVWGWAAFIVIFPTILAYFFNYWALKRVESSLVAFFIYVQPILTAILSLIFRGEGLTTRMIISAFLIFIGFLISVLRK